MLRVVFVCLGNICRSPMAECIMSNLINNMGLKGKIEVESRATSNEEEGNPIYPPAKSVLRKNSIPVLPHTATRLERADANRYDYFLGMEDRNVRAIRHIIGEENSGRVYRLLDFSDNPRDIADPWWTGDFEKAYADIYEGCVTFLNAMLPE